jgi:rod shape determining protein RodA
MRREIKIDWITVVLYIVLVIWGWTNIYAASSHDESITILNIDFNFGKQFIFILVAAVFAVVLLTLDHKFIELLSYPAYAASILLLVAVLVLGREVNGSRSWIELGSFRLQPSEFAKLCTALGVTKYMARYNFSIGNLQQRMVVFGMIALPALLILIQGDTGSMLVFSAFFLMFFREGMAPIYLILAFLAVLFVVLALLVNKFIVIGIIIALTLISFGLLFRWRYLTLHLLLGALFCFQVFSVDFVVSRVLQPHQQHRMRTLFNPNNDPLGVGWNITQSKIAIGSGGIAGKGFMEGTQTKFDFVPQQDTDFIFCTVGEEYGWIGSMFLLGCFMLLLYQMLMMAENAKSRFARIYGYSITSIFFFHIAVNLGMTMGLMPVIGIPLPFFSYGGSSLISFTVMLFILLNFYANRVNILGTER